MNPEKKNKQAVPIGGGSLVHVDILESYGGRMTLIHALNPGNPKYSLTHAESGLCIDHFDTMEQARHCAQLMLYAMPMQLWHDPNHPAFTSIAYEIVKQVKSGNVDAPISNDSTQGPCTPRESTQNPVSYLESCLALKDYPTGIYGALES